MARQITDKSAVLFKYNGTATSANAVTVTETPFLSPDVKSQEYKEIGSGKLGQTKNYVDANNTTVQFDLVAMLRGNDKTGVAPETPPAIADLLKACGLTETIGADNVTYTPNHNDVSSSQAVVYIDDYKRVIDGAIATLKISGTVGECAKATFSVSGYTTPAATSEVNPTVTLDTESLMIVSRVSAITVDGSTINAESFDFDIGNDIKSIYAISVGEFIRTDFKPTIALSGIKTKGDESGWSDLIAEDVREIIIVLGSGAGKTVTITASQAKTSEMSESDNDGMVNFSRTFRCQGDANGDNHYSIKWS